MSLKKILIAIGIVLTILLVAVAVFIVYTKNQVVEAYNTENKPYKHYVGYIDQSKALLNDKHELCNKGALMHTYSSASLKAYAGSKKRFRNALNNTFNAKTNYTDSGYLNFRFLVNCEGNAGWFEIVEMDLDLKETPLNKDMVNDLFEFTSNSEHWDVVSYNEKARNYYMYISYRIENGKVTEIIP